MGSEKVKRLLEELASHSNSVNGEAGRLESARDYDVIPLRDGSWTCIAAGPVFWSESGNASIPNNLDIRLVNESELQNDDHRHLLEFLGVQNAPPADVRSLILRKHNDLQWISPADCRDHIRFLYSTHEYRRADEDFRSVCVFNRGRQLVRPHLQDVYLSGIAPFSPEQLLGQILNDQWDRLESHGCLLHDLFLNDAPEQPHTAHPTWKRWLCSHVGVLEQIRLVDRSGSSISKDFLELSQARPDLLLGTLGQIWESQGHLISGRPDLLDELKLLPVPCLAGEMQLLRDTYLPLENLQKQCGEFMKPNEHFPFLDFGYKPTAEELAGKWSFLCTELEVSSCNNTGFLLNILSYIQEANSTGLSVSRCRELVQLYSELEIQCQKCEEPESLRDICRSFIEEISGVAVPEMFESSPEWAHPRNCRWDAPLYMTTKVPLRYVYEDVLMCNSAELAIMSSFFQKTMCVPPITWQDLALELVSLRDRGARDLDHIMRIYECLDQLSVSGYEYNQIRLAFEKEPLIFVPTDGLPNWVKRSQCLWSSKIDISDKVTLDNYYSGIKLFFLRTLNVDRLTAELVYDKLLELGLETAPMSELGEALETFSALLDPDSEFLDPKPLLRRKIWPVKYADQSTRLVSADTDFVIIDREHLAAPFAGRVRILDVSLNEAWRLKPLFKWAGLEDRYLCVMARETTFVADGLSSHALCSERDIKGRAHALIRIASAFGSPRLRHDGTSLFRLLEAARMVKTNAISAIYSLIQDRKVITSKPMKSDLHIAEEGGALVIYVPGDQKARDICFATTLPEKLSEWLMGDELTNKVESTMTALVGAALNYDVSVLDQILARQGIGHVDLSLSSMDELPSPGTANLTQKMNQMGPLQSPPISERGFKRPCLKRETTILRLGE